MNSSSQRKNKSTLLLGGLQSTPDDNDKRNATSSTPQRMRFILSDSSFTLADLRAKLIRMAKETNNGFVPANGAFSFRYYDDEEDCEVELWEAEEKDFLANEFIGKKLTPIPKQAVSSSPITCTGTSRDVVREVDAPVCASVASAAAVVPANDLGNMEDEKKPRSENSPDRVASAVVRNHDDKTSSSSDRGHASLPQKKRARSDRNQNDEPTSVANAAVTNHGHKAFSSSGKDEKCRRATEISSSSDRDGRKFQQMLARSRRSGPQKIGACTALVRVRKKKSIEGVLDLTDGDNCDSDVNGNIELSRADAAATRAKRARIKTEEATPASSEAESFLQGSLRLCQPVLGGRAEQDCVPKENGDEPSHQTMVVDNVPSAHEQNIEASAHTTPVAAGDANNDKEDHDIEPRALESPEMKTEPANSASPAGNDNDEPAVVASEQLSPEVKEEQARQESKKKREDVYKKYADRYLLDRQDLQNGIGRLGGGVQTTFPHPKLGHKSIWRVYKKNRKELDEEYPIPRHLLSSEDFLNGELPDMLDFTYLCFDMLWQPNAPKYAGQPFGAFDYFPPQFIEVGKACPVFIKRSRTTKYQENEGKRLGWEYVGNYKYSCPLDDDNDPNEFDLSYWESASNFSRASKNKMVQKTLKSAEDSNIGYGRRRINEWRQKLTEALQRDKSPAAPSYLVEKRKPTEDEQRERLPSLAARARALGFRENMPDKDFLYLLVELNEYHKQVSVEFVEYDERIYEYLKKGKTNKDRYGNDATALSPPARAGDWYAFAEEHMLM